jgi:hypothetical protein
MPRLDCSEDNPSSDSKLSVEIVYKDLEEKNYINSKEKWLTYEIVFQIGEKTEIYKSISKKSRTATGSEAEIGKFAFMVEPKNEIQNLQKQIDKLLENSEKQSMIFQPYDPSFEIEIFKINPQEFKVYFWIDAGNSNQLEYSWDSFGLRFLTNKKKLEKFKNSL